VAISSDCSDAMRSGEEIQADLGEFVTRWREYSGTERSEAQTFLNELIACYGADRKAVGVRFEDAHTANGIMDMHWPSVCIVEMKAPSRADKLPEHRAQALNYWQSSDDSAQNRAAPPYVVLCAFTRFEVWEPGRFPSAPRADFTLDELPENYEKLLFLTGTDQEPLFGASYKELTTDAAKVVVELYQALLERRAAAPETLRTFVLQIVWCLFAEDLGMLEGHPVQRIVENLVRHAERSSYTELGTLFDVLNDPTDYGRYGVLHGTRYVNGSLFAQPAKVHLEQDELAMLVAAAEFDWRKVDPTIFGSLMEGCLGRDRRWELGAHYTHEADIMKIVRPTIVEPWRERIDATATLADVRRALEELCAFRVLDPACGCGNFLYVAYRELRSLEHELKERLVRVARQTGMPLPDPGSLPYYAVSNLRGMDIEPIAVLIARVTLWMGQRLMIDRFGAAEPALPLVDLSGIQVGDALELSWPDADCIIGNPPFLGASHLRAARGDAYVERLKTAFNAGVKDYCVYWFRKAHDNLSANQRAGLVGTNSISQNLGRSASLDYIVNNGGVITDAVSSQKWPGDARVHVSLVNWIKTPFLPPVLRILDGQPVSSITTELRIPERSTGSAHRLPANFGKAFEGPSPKASGFVIEEEEAQRLLADPGAAYADVVRPYLGSADVAGDVHQAARRFAIDFGVMPLQTAMKYPAALDIVRERVNPERDGKKPPYVGNWWQFNRPRPELRRAVAGLKRYIVMGAHGKRLLFVWQDPWTLASNATKLFTFDDDYAMGVLALGIHGYWARSRASTIEERLRYTHTSCFETFPWPLPITDNQRDRIAEASRRLYARRADICIEGSFGLTTLYNAVNDGAYSELTAMHNQLDETVSAAYGWPKSVAHDGDEIVRRLLELNLQIAAGTRPYDPFDTQAAAADAELLVPE
jgi:hypothetical protein